MYECWEIVSQFIGDLNFIIYLSFSTLFNTFLQSDLCKVRAVDLVERVTTSVWPGTTLSLLKFPVMTPTTRRMELRRRRLLSHKAWIKKEVRFQQELFERTEDPKFLSLLGSVESTFRESELDSQPLSKEENEQLFEGKDITELREKRVKSLKLDALDFTGGQWGFDTPGTVSNDQVCCLNDLILKLISCLDFGFVNIGRINPCYSSLHDSATHCRLWCRRFFVDWRFGPN